eukprot:gene20237-25924_t
MSDLFSLAGRTALITGGSRGIGKMIAAGFIAAGAKVYISARKEVACRATAEELGMKIVLEGYPPPRDARLKVLAVTPDPGVIEVNIHPASHWKELVQHTEFLYQAAWETRLSAEKFMTDGRHTGTGGGNHFVMG